MHKEVRIVRKMSWMKYLTLVSQLGFTMITPILICVFIGTFIDERTNKAPLFTIVFILLGVGGAFRNLFYLVGKNIKKEDKDE